MEILAIVNPRAGGGGDEGGDGLSLLTGLGEFRVKVPRSGEETVEAAREASGEGYDRIVVVGGDGTVNAVVNGIVPEDAGPSGGDALPSVAILPGGTGNDLARSLGIPLEPAEAAKLLGEGEVRAIDLIRVEMGGRITYAANASTGGFSGEVDEELDDERKRRWGPTAYLRTALDAAPDLRDYRTEIRFDGGEAREHDVFSVVVANGRSVAGGVPVAPEARLDDGVLDVIVIDAGPLPELAALVPRILAGDHLDHELVGRHRVETLGVRASPGMWFNVDGELLGKEPAGFRVLPGALRFVVGPGEDAAF